MSMGSYFESIGIVGWNKFEPAIFAALKTETPINLIGDKGTAKTGFASLISKALQGKNCRFQKYDTPDVTMDTVLGLLDLESMKTGKVEFCHTGTSIWNKTSVLWDEINRAGPMIQGKLLEAVRTKSIHGLPTDVKFMFATCNPPRKTQNSVGHDVYYLADAMAGRFFHVQVPGSTIHLFDSAAKTLPIRESIEAMDEDAGKHTSSIMKMWLEYTRIQPTQSQSNAAHAIVRDVMEHINGSGSESNQKKNLGGYLDMRAALRSREMVAEVLALHSMERVINIVDVVAMCITGNIAEVNGIIRNDKSGDIQSIQATVAESFKRHTKDIQTKPGTGTTAPVLSMTFKMAQSGTFDEINFDALEKAVSADPKSLRDALMGLTRKQSNSNDKYRSVQYRSGHKAALERVLSSAQKALGDDETLGVSFNLPVSNAEIHIQVDSGTFIFKEGSLHRATAVTSAEHIHNAWYRDCGFQSK